MKNVLCYKGERVWRETTHASTFKSSKQAKPHYLDRTLYCNDVVVPPIYVWIAGKHWLRH